MGASTGSTYARTDLNDAVPSDDPSLLGRGLSHGCIHQPACALVLAYVHTRASQLCSQILSLSRLRPPDRSSVLHSNLARSAVLCSQ